MRRNARRSPLRAGALAAALAAGLLVWAAPALAQDAPEAPPERWGADFGIALNASGGNERLTVLTSSVGITHLQKDDFELGFSGAFRYGRSEGEEVARNSRIGLNFDFQPLQAWSPFVFATAENDPFRKLDLRFNGGAGVKRTFWREDWSEVSVSAATLYSHEALDLTPGESVINRTARWSWRLRGRRQIGDRSRVEQVFFYQPELSYGEDYLLESLSSARMGLTETLTLDVTFRYDRDSTPAPDVRADDWALTTGLRVATKW